MPSVIDQFIIKVKLDTSEYEAGQKKLDKLNQQTKERSKEAGSEFGDAMESAAKKSTNKLGILGSMLGKGGAIGIAVGSLIYAGKILDNKLFDIALGVRRVGIDSKNFNIAANNLRNLQNMAELAGGTMEDANKTVGGLAGSLYNLKFNGAVDDSLIALGRLGIRFQDSYGRAKDFNTIMLETADAIDKAKASGKLTDSEAFFIAGQAGFQGGLQNLVTSGGANVREQLAKQAARKQITGDTLATSNRMVNASISLGQEVVAKGGLTAIEKYGNTRANAQEFLEKSGGAVIDFLSDVGDKLDEFGKSVDEATKRVDKFLGTKPGSTGTALSSASNIARFGPVLGPLISMYDSATSSTDSTLTRAQRNHNPFNLRAVGDQPRDDKGFRVFNSDAEAIAAADHQLELYRSRGNGTLGGMIKTWAPSNENDTELYIKQMEKATGMSASHVVAPEERAQLLSAMAMKESSTNISVDQINIHTQATDAQGIARDINGALTRQKMLAAHAERGAQ